MCVGVWVGVCVYLYSCKQLPGNQVLIGKYLPTRRVVVSGGWGNGSGSATAYKFVTDINWGPLDHSS